MIVMQFKLAKKQHVFRVFRVQCVMQSSLPIGGMAVKILFWKWKNRLLFNSRRSQTLSPCADVTGLSTAKENLQADMLLTQQGELRLPFFRRKLISLDHIKILLSESLFFFAHSHIPRWQNAQLHCRTPPWHVSSSLADPEVYHCGWCEETTNGMCVRVIILRKVKHRLQNLPATIRACCLVKVFLFWNWKIKK